MVVLATRRSAKDCGQSHLVAGRPRWVARLAAARLLGWLLLWARPGLLQPAWSTSRAMPPSGNAAAAAATARKVASGQQLASTGESKAVESVRRYFGAWNERDMDAACATFADDCTYEDTQYAGAFSGKEALKAHLFKVADALPPTFQFCIDEIADGGEFVGVQWHVENDGQALPFTRGCSMYRADADTGKLVSGFDVPEPAPFKPGSASLSVLSLASKIIAEPIRALPLFVFVSYVVIVFFSNGILPGKDATQLDPATWEEVLNLSLNFWLISPLLQLPFAPVLHPGLEGIFNLLLAWAGLFAGFMSDGRPGRPSGSMLGTIVGMQFLTNAVYLPYLVSRSPEPDDARTVYREDLDANEALVSENRLLGPVLAVVGAGSVCWGFWARPEFGDLPTRWASLCTFLSGDRLGSSFVVDLVLFAIFQGWLVDDDLRRRGVAKDDLGTLRTVAKFVPFLGLVAYMLLRPEYPSHRSAGDEAAVAAV
mmetsp:Transcript_78441/g.197050  ORF Transcript_78441/g.197050 Transcript_78441/m.197050 type:complete len:483 (-) Transcript_78441:71-1519(-)